MSAIVVFCTDVALNEDVDLDGRVYRQSEKPLAFVIVETVLPVYAIFCPHFTESLQSYTFLASCEAFGQFIEYLFVEDLPTDLEKGHKFGEFELSTHKKVEFAEDIHYLLLLIWCFLYLRLRIDEGNYKINARRKGNTQLYLSIMRKFLAEERFK